MFQLTPEDGFSYTPLSQKRKQTPKPKKSKKRKEEESFIPESRSRFEQKDQIVQNNVRNEEAIEVRNESDEKDAPSSERKEECKANSKSKFCVICQMPFDLLPKFSSPEIHQSLCVDANLSILSECPLGAKCDSLIPNHFIKYKHEELARRREVLEKRDSILGDSFLFLSGSGWYLL